MKNTNAIDKIISELAMKDYLQANPKKADGRPKYKKHHAYSLSDETRKRLDALENDITIQLINMDDYPYVVEYVDKYEKAI